MVCVNRTLVAMRTLRLPALPNWLAAWLLAERGRGGPWLAVAMAVGAAGYFALTIEPAAWVGPAALAGAVALCLLGWRWLPGRWLGLAVLAAAAGFASGQSATQRAPPPLTLPRTATVVTGVVRGVETLPEGRRLTLADARLAGGPALPRYLHIRLRAADPGPIAAGDTVSVRAVLRPPAPPAYPGAWDLQRDAYFAGLGGAGTALGPVQILARSPAAGAARWLQGVRDAIAARIMAGLPGPPGAIAATLLTGAASAIPLADRAAFRDSGLAHLLAVAGLHIGIVMGLVMGGSRFLLALWERAALFWPCKQVAALLALAAGGGYVLLTGAHVPVLRSFAMAALVTLGIAVGRRAISLRGLALAAIALLLVSPQEITGVSFQMSFAAVLALIAGYEALRPAFARLRGQHSLRHVAMLVTTSLLAGVASAPFAAYHFGHVQAYFILANLVAVPLTALWIMPWGLLALLLMPLGLGHLALWPMGLGIDLVLLVARWVAALPAATVPVPHLPLWGLVVLAGGLAWLGLWRSPMRLAGLAAIAAGLLAGLWSPPADLLVSDDARLIGFRGRPGEYLQTRPGFSRFVADGWMQYWGASFTASFPETGLPGPVACDAEGCRIASGGATVLLARSLKPMDCTGAALVVSAEPARAVCPSLPRIDRFTVWRDGAHAVWLRDGVALVLSDRADRGDRPWVPPSPQSGHTTVGLPMAERDSGND